jgi:hypothetical protein
LRACVCARARASCTCACEGQQRSRAAVGKDAAAHTQSACARARGRVSPYACAWVSGVCGTASGAVPPLCRRWRVGGPPMPHPRPCCADTIKHRCLKPPDSWNIADSAWNAAQFRPLSLQPTRPPSATASNPATCLHPRVRRRCRASPPRAASRAAGARGPAVAASLRPTQGVGPARRRRAMPTPSPTPPMSQALPPPRPGFKLAYSEPPTRATVSTAIRRALRVNGAHSEPKHRGHPSRKPARCCGPFGSPPCRLGLDAHATRPTNFNWFHRWPGPARV